MPTIHLIVTGRVQGVFYRATAKQVAEESAITGWIKNTKEGNVEIMATGAKEQLQEFINWCKQGPPEANVTNIAITSKPEEKFDGFRISI